MWQLGATNHRRSLLQIGINVPNRAFIVSFIIYSKTFLILIRFWICRCHNKLQSINGFCRYHNRTTNCCDKNVSEPFSDLCNGIRGRSPQQRIGSLWSGRQFPTGTNRGCSSPRTTPSHPAVSLSRFRWAAAVPS